MGAKGRRFKPDEDQYLINSYGKIDVSIIMLHLDRGLFSIRRRAGRLGLTSKRGSNVVNGKAQRLGAPLPGQQTTLEQALDDFGRRHMWGLSPKMRDARAGVWLGG